MKYSRIMLILMVTLGFFNQLNAQMKDDYCLNILFIGAHPDDVDNYGGSAYKWVQRGHNVIFVSTTNGNAGHHILNREDLASVRREEAKKAGDVIGSKYILMDNSDGELMPTYENRLKIIRLIREHEADIVITHRPYDYHPDHRYTGTLVLDAAYMVTVPLILPEVPYLKKNPVFLYMYDQFKEPLPFRPDVCVDVDGEAIEKSIDMLHQHTSQMYEWLPYNMKTMDQVPQDETERRTALGESIKNDRTIDPLARKKLIELYGARKGKKIKFADCFQDSGYGTRLTGSNLNYYFPFFD